MANIYSMVDNHFAELDKAYDETVALNDRLTDMLETSGGEITPEIELLQLELESKQKDFEDLRAELADNLEDKIDDCCRWLKNVQSNIAPLKSEEARLAALRKREEKKAEWIQSNILFGMNALGAKKLHGKFFSPSVRESKSVVVDEQIAIAPYQHIIDAALAKLPSWLPLVPKINKTLAKKEKTLPEGFAIKSNQSLIIR